MNVWVLLEKTNKNVGKGSVEEVVVKQGLCCLVQQSEKRDKNAERKREKEKEKTEKRKRSSSFCFFFFLRQMLMLMLLLSSYFLLRIQTQKNI